MKIRELMGLIQDARRRMDVAYHDFQQYGGAAEFAALTARMREYQAACEALAAAGR